MENEAASPLSPLISHHLPFFLTPELSPPQGSISDTIRRGSISKSFFLAIVIIAAATPTLTQTPAKTTVRNIGIEHTVLELTHEWIAADERADRAALTRIIAEDFMGTGPTGRIVLKEDVIPMEGSQGGGFSITAQEVKARVFGDSAVVTGRGVRKSPEQGDLRFTLVSLSDRIVGRW